MRYRLTLIAVTLATAALVAGCLSNASAREDAEPLSAAEREKLSSAIFAGGCFWCMEPPFDKLDGVVATTSGYIGGRVENPTYHAVSSGATGHTEAVEILYDPEKIDYARLLDVFWHNIDPTVSDRQFCDHGDQYRTGIFYDGGEEKRLAEASRDAILAAGTVERIVTEITPASTFYPAEEYHQNYYVKNPIRYKTYRRGCGRDRRLKELWGDDAGH